MTRRIPDWSYPLLLAVGVWAACYAAALAGAGNARLTDRYPAGTDALAYVLERNLLAAALVWVLALVFWRRGAFVAMRVAVVAVACCWALVGVREVLAADLAAGDILTATSAHMLLECASLFVLTAASATRRPWPLLALGLGGVIVAALVETTITPLLV